MLGISLEKVCYLILELRELQAKEQVVIPEEASGLSDDWALQVLADHRGDASYRELQYLIDPEEQINLVALMWLGRGDYSVEVWDEALDEARAQLTGRTSADVIKTPLVADYLEEGVSELGYSLD